MRLFSKILTATYVCLKVNKGVESESESERGMLMMRVWVRTAASTNTHLFPRRQMNGDLDLAKSSFADCLSQHIVANHLALHRLRGIARIDRFTVASRFTL